MYEGTLWCFHMVLEGQMLKGRENLLASFALVSGLWPPDKSDNNSPFSSALVSLYQIQKL